jgi:undecaprenyl-diphosphatase
MNNSRKSPSNYLNPLIDPESISFINPVIESIETIDNNLSIKVQKNMGSPVLRLVMRYLTRSADGYMYFVMAALIATVDVDLALQLSAFALLAFAIEIPAQKLIKNRFRRSRPFAAGKGINGFIAPPDMYSFPSGHTAGAVIMTYSLIQVLSYDMLGAFGLISIVIWAFGVGISRIYLGMHFSSDVLAGALLGLLSCFAAALLLL